MSERTGRLAGRWPGLTGQYAASSGAKQVEAAKLAKTNVVDIPSGSYTNPRAGKPLSTTPPTSTVTPNTSAVTQAAPEQIASAPAAAAAPTPQSTVPPTGTAPPAAAPVAPSNTTPDVIQNSANAPPTPAATTQPPTTSSEPTPAQEQAKKLQDNSNKKPRENFDITNATHRAWLIDGLTTSMNMAMMIPGFARLLGKYIGGTSFFYNPLNGLPASPDVWIGPFPLFGVTYFDWAESDNVVKYRAKGNEFFGHQAGQSFAMVIDGVTQGIAASTTILILRALKYICAPRPASLSDAEKQKMESMVKTTFDANSKKQLADVIRMTSEGLTGGSNQPNVNNPLFNPDTANEIKNDTVTITDLSGVNRFKFNKNTPMYHVNFPVITRNASFYGMYVETAQFIIDSKNGVDVVKYHLMLRKEFVRSKIFQTTIKTSAGPKAKEPKYFMIQFQTVDKEDDRIQKFSKAISILGAGASAIFKTITQPGIQDMKTISGLESSMVEEEVIQVKQEDWFQLSDSATLYLADGDNLSGVAVAGFIKKFPYFKNLRLIRINMAEYGLPKTADVYAILKPKAVMFRVGSKTLLDVGYGRLCNISKSNTKFTRAIAVSVEIDTSNNTVVVSGIYG